MTGELSSPMGPAASHVDPVFRHPEEAVRQKIGVARSWVREHRGPEGLHWQRVGQAILWSDRGVAALEMALNAKMPAAVEEPRTEPKTAAPELPEPVVTLVVWRSRIQNQRVLLAHAEGVDSHVVTVMTALTVWVRDNTRFQPGMRLLARARTGSDRLFDFAGNPDNPAAGCRLPRRPGLW